MPKVRERRIEDIMQDSTYAMKALTDTLNRHLAAFEALVHLAVTQPEKVAVSDLKELFNGYLTSADTDRTKQRMVTTLERLLEPYGKKRITDVEAKDRSEVFRRGNMLVEAYAAGGIEAAERVDFGT